MGCCLSSHPAAAAGGGGRRVASLSRRWSAKGRATDSAAPGGPRRSRSTAVEREMTEEELARVPGRMCGSGASGVACLHTQQGRKGTNQDAMLAWENFSGNAVLCGVFDGHGPFGHFVAKKVRDTLPLKLLAEWKASVSEANSPRRNGCVSESLNSEEAAYANVDDGWGDPLDVDEAGKLPETFLPLKQAFLKAFKTMDKELKLHPTIDCFCSGTTAVTVLKQERHLVIGNLGDSRAIVGTRDENNCLIAEQLTVDLKPNLPREAARIEQCRGRVFALQDEPEVSRVWLPNNDSPGLAMARAFGDFCLKDYGLISIPVVSYRHLSEKDEFIILATDGVWDVLSNKEAVDIVASSPTRATAARALVECAVRSWRLKFPTSKSDDCAVVCLFLEQKSPTEPILPRGFEADSVETSPPEGESRSNNENITASPASEAQTGDTTIEHQYTICDGDEIVPFEEPSLPKVPDRSGTTRRLADHISSNDDEEWSALEGVTRVNSLLNLPRFLSIKRSSSWRKWL